MILNIIRIISKEHVYLFLFFLSISLIYIFNGFAVLQMNDDLALVLLLVAHDVYGTLIMSYPLSYTISRLYDVFPSIQWYSLILSSIFLLNIYITSYFISVHTRL